ncbi:voltage-gated potassium channel [Aureococcus anophagefferens]|nr:voltage-gated potassium channel [Aureococcus anophagefferens]
MDGRGSYEEVPGGDDAGPCAPRASRRGRLAVVGGLLSAAALASLGLGSSSWLARGQTASSQLSSVSTYKFTYKDFVKEDDIKAYLEMIGVEGSLGSDAAGGYLLTGLTFTASSGFTSSYVLVFTLEGKIERITSLYGKQLENKGATSLDKHTIYQALGLKLYNTTHALVAFGDSTGKLEGPRMLWAWRSDEWLTLCDGKTNDAHDIQWAFDDAAVWQADGTTLVGEYDVVSGKKLAKFDEKRVSDPNHVQAVAEDKVEWTLGGEYGDYEIEDSDGTVYKAGKTVWSGQHNAEFFGEDEFCMFDNQEKPDNHYSHSRLLCVKLEKDGSTRRGVVTFSYSMGAYTPHFGDADRLPTGNMLGVHWPDELTDATDYDVHAVVTFDVVNNFKQMNVYDGTYMIKTISKDDTVDKTDGTLSFLAHWRTTPVSVDVPSAAAKATVIVTNQWGDDVSTEVDCTK